MEDAWEVHPRADGELQEETERGKGYCAFFALLPLFVVITSHCPHRALFNECGVVVVSA